MEALHAILAASKRASEERLGRALHFKEIRNLARKAEEHGFDSIWLYDHLLYEEEERTIGIWECWSMLAALAAVTKKPELGTLVCCNNFRNPALLAKMAVTVDEISGGRLTLGMGAGWNEPEYRAFGLPFDHRVDRFEEAVQIVRPLLKQGKVDFHGQYYEANNCRIAPRGPRPGGPPLLVGSFGPRMLRLTARYADLWNCGYHASPDTMVKARQEMAEACAAEGRDPASLPVTAMAPLAFPDLIRGPMPEFENGPALSGSAEQVAAGIRRFEQAGVAQLMFHLVPANPRGFTRLAEAVKLWKER